MQKNKIIYLKNTPDEDSPFYFPYYFKVVEKKEAYVLEVTESSIAFRKEDDFHNEVHFIKEKLCEGGWEEISRHHFDGFYRATVEKINKISAL